MIHPTILGTDPGSPADRAVVLHWPDEGACAATARALAACPGVQDALITLEGELGAGKTTFVRHLLHALGVQGRIKSPTYALVEPYEVPVNRGALSIHHFDFYRLADPREWEEAGFRDVFAAPGLKLCEWPDKAATLLPEPDLRMAITVEADERRTVRLQAASATGRALAQAALGVAPAPPER